MLKDTTVVRFRQPDAIDDPLTELAREGARRMLAQALIAEADAFVALWKGLKLPDGRDRVVRHGHGPHRAIQTGVGPVEVRRGKVRDRGDVGAEEKIRFTSSILPKWARRTKSLDALLPVLYLRGVSTGDFQEALAALLGKAAPNLSPAVISRLTAEWQADYDAWQKRDLSARRYVYVWADGVYLQARMEPAAECMLVLIGATPEGKKELLGFQTGGRERAKLARTPHRHQATWARDRARPRGRRRRARLLEGNRGGLSGCQAPAVLGSQDRQRAEQSSPLGPDQHEGRPSRNLRCADPRDSRGGYRCVR
jgi:putative transposase